MARRNLLIICGLVLTAACATNAVRVQPSPALSSSRPVRVNNFERLAQLVGDKCYVGKQDPSAASVASPDGLPDGEATALSWPGVSALLQAPFGRRTSFSGSVSML